jgi:N-methylhydantoinase A
VRLPDGGFPGDFAELLGEAHERNYGFRAPPDEPVELIGLSVIARGMPERPRLPEAIPPASIPAPASRRAWFPDLGWVDTPVVDRAGLASHARTGPLIVQEYDATCLVPRGIGAALDAFGNIRLTRTVS